MRAPLSVVIPTLNAADELPDCLAALVEGLEAGIIRELIVSDGGSDDATGALAQAWGARIVSGEASRGGQLRRGCAVAQGNWLLVLHADTVLAPGWTAVVREAMRAPQARWFRLRFDAGGLMGRLVAGWANLRSRFGLPYGDQGLLIARPLYEKLGGYPDQPLMEDVTLALLLKGRLRGLDAVAVTSAGKYQSQGWLRRGARNLWILGRYLLGADPAVLARAYRR